MNEQHASKQQQQHQQQHDTLHTLTKEYGSGNVTASQIVVRLWDIAHADDPNNWNAYQVEVWNGAAVLVTRGLGDCTYGGNYSSGTTFNITLQTD